MIKILYTTALLEHPAAGGPQISVETCIKALSRVSDLHVISRVPLHSIGGSEAQRFYEKYCTAFLYSPSARLLPKNKHLLRAKRRWIKLTNQEVKFILKYFDENKMDVIWCDRVLDLAASFDFFCGIKLKRPEIKVVGDTCAVQSRFILRELPYQKSPERRKAIITEGELAKRNEQTLVDTADVTTAAWYGSKFLMFIYTLSDEVRTRLWPILMTLA